MWNHQYLKRIDFRTLPIIAILMVMSILIIASTTSEVQITGEDFFFTPTVKNQIQRFGVGILCYLFFAGLDYHKLREWAWILYIGTILLLFGLFFTESIQHVHRWYRIPFVGGTLQPSEYAKLSLVLTLSWFLEKKGRNVGDWRTFFQASLIVFIPFVLILKQPDLGSAMVLYPMTLGMFYFGGIKRKIIWIVECIQRDIGKTSMFSLFGLVILLFFIHWTSFGCGCLSHQYYNRTCNTSQLCYNRITLIRRTDR